MSVLMVTSVGDIVIDLFSDRCPLTCKNFLKLCKIKYYNGCLFHTVQKDFTAQTGDPTGTGLGGDSIYKSLYGREQARFFGDEIRLDLKHSKTGTVAMAASGGGGDNILHASQFYFTLRDDLDYLDGKDTVFGEVAEGFDTLTRINEAYVDARNRPYKNIRIKHTYILEDPFDDPPQLAEMIPDASPQGKPKEEEDKDDDVLRLEDDWVPMDEDELEEVIREKAAHSSAVVLECIGDIPEAEVKPPENVLFVCELNPVTEDEDLHTIFSRFGTVVSADVIRDFKTGDSWCYAFIEFEGKEACEQAYLKMDNALIDDRRIHVDFSQSVSKHWSQLRRQKGSEKGKGNGGEGYDMVFEGDGAERKREKSYEKEENLRRRRSRPHGYGEVKRQDRDDGTRHHREEPRDRDRDTRYDDGASREKKHREGNERDSEERRRKRRREETRDRERRVESRRERDDHWSDKGRRR